MKYSINKLSMITLLILQGLLVSSCSNNGPTNTGVYLLLDTSGTYTKELANALKPVALPGETISIHIIKKGKEEDIIQISTEDFHAIKNNLK